MHLDQLVPGRSDPALAGRMGGEQFRRGALFRGRHVLPELHAFFRVKPGARFGSLTPVIAQSPSAVELPRHEVDGCNFTEALI